MLACFAVWTGRWQLNEMPRSVVHTGLLEPPTIWDHSHVHLVLLLPLFKKVILSLFSSKVSKQRLQKKIVGPSPP